MIKQLVLLFILFAGPALSVRDNCPCEAAGCLPSFPITEGQGDSATLALLHALFEEHSSPHPSVLDDSVADPNLHFIAESSVELTFYHEGAGYRNELGYYLFDNSGAILSEHLLFPDVSYYSPGCLEYGDTITFGPFSAGTHLGFYIRANGYNGGGSKFYSGLNYAELNPDKLRHVGLVRNQDTGALLIGFEDLFNLGDKDYNDAMFTVMVTAGSIESDKIPVAAEGKLVTDGYCMGTPAPTSTFERAGTLWATLSGADPSSTSMTCFSANRKVPDGFSVVPATQHGFSNLVRRGWAANHAVLSDGQAYSPVTLQPSGAAGLLTVDSSTGCHSLKVPCYNTIPIMKPNASFSANFMAGMCNANVGSSAFTLDNQVTIAPSAGHAGCQTHCISAPTTAPTAMSQTIHVPSGSSYRAGARIGVWVSATGAAGGDKDDFALYVDVTYSDGTSAAFVEPLPRGSYPATFHSVNVYGADKEIAYFHVHTTFRNGVSGSVCFSDWSVSFPDPNILINPSFRPVVAGGDWADRTWESLDASHATFLVASGGHNSATESWEVDSSEMCLGDKCGTSTTSWDGRAMYGAQQFVTDPRLVGCRAIRFGGYSKCNGCVGTGIAEDYSVYLDIHHHDGTAVHAVVAAFDKTKTNWHLAQTVVPISNTAGVARVVVTVIFRGLTGSASFDRVFVDPIRGHGNPVRLGVMYGDPHVLTLDGQPYDQQAVGEFTMVRDDSVAGGFEVQVRTAPAANHRASIVTAAAIKSLCTRVEIMAASDGADPTLRMHGGLVGNLAAGAALPLGSSCPEHPGGVLTRHLMPAGSDASDVVLAEYTITWFSLAHSVSVTVFQSQYGVQFLQVTPFVPASSAGMTRGLLGNNDGIANENDFANPAGTSVSVVSESGMYDFVNSWRVSDATSAFTYKAGRTTADYTDMSFHLTLADAAYTEEERATARAACAGVGSSDLVTACEYDVLATGDTSLAQAAAVVATSVYNRGPAIEGTESSDTGASVSASSGSNGWLAGVLAGAIGVGVLGTVLVCVFAVVASVMLSFAVSSCSRTRKNSALSAPARRDEAGKDVAGIQVPDFAPSAMIYLAQAQAATELPKPTRKFRHSTAGSLPAAALRAVSDLVLEAARTLSVHSTHQELDGDAYTRLAEVVGGPMMEVSREDEDQAARANDDIV